MQRTTSVNTTVIGYTIILLLQILFCERANRINGVAFFLCPLGGLMHELSANTTTALVGIGMENREMVAV